MDKLQKPDLQKQLELLNMQLYAPASLQKARQASIRHSISIIQSNNEDHEDQLKEVKDKYKHEMEIKSQRYEDLIANLKNDLEDRTNMAENLKGHLNECRAAKQAALEELMKTRERYTARIQELEGCIHESKQKLEQLNEEKQRRQSEVQKRSDLQEMLDEKEEEIKCLKEHLAEREENLEEKQDVIDKLSEEAKAMEENLKTYKEENESLRKQLAEYIEKCKHETNSANEVLQQELSKLEKDKIDLKTKLDEALSSVTELKTDLKDIQREKIDVKIQMRKIEMENRKLERALEDKTNESKKLEEKVNAFGDMDKTVQTLQTTVDSLTSKIERKEKDYEDLMSIKNVLTEQKIQLTTDNDSLRKKLDLHGNVIKENEELKKIIQQKDEVLQEKVSQLQAQQRQNQSHKSSIEKLKDTLTLLEDQLVQMENALTSQSAEVESLTSIRDMLKEENHKLRSDLNKAKIEVNEAKSLKTFTERRLEMTEKTLKTENESKEMEKHVILEKLAVASSRNEELSLELSELTTKVSNLEGENLELNTNLKTLQGQKERLDREISGCVKTLVDLKEENDSLKQALSETLSKAEGYKRQVESIQENLLELKEHTRITDIQNKTKLDQQGKLINHLTEELAKFEKKKHKGGLGILTPRRNEKELHTPSRTAATTPLPDRYKAVLGQLNNKAHHNLTPLKLEQERQDVEQLQQHRDDLKSRLQNLQIHGGLTPLTRKNPTLPAPKKEENILLKERSNTVGVTRGNRAATGNPHKYHEGRYEVTKKCMACFEPIYKGRPASQCQECEHVFHLACSLTAGDTCGLSENKTYEIEKDISSKRAEPISNEADDDVRGFVLVKSDNMPYAEQRLLVIEDGKLKVYAHPNDRKVAKPAAMYPLNENTMVQFRVDKKEIPTNAKIDIPFATKAIFFFEDGKSTILYMFHKNKQQKRYWVRAILKYSKMEGESATDNTLSDFSVCSDDNKENQLIKVNEKVLVETPYNKLYVNCVIYSSTSKAYLLGCDDGLYSVREVGGSPVKIEGPSAVYEMQILEAAKLGVFIEGTQRKLSTVFSGLLKSCAEAAQCSSPRFTTKEVPYTKDCYMLASQSETLEATVVAAACSSGLLLCTLERGELIAKREFKLKHNITALLMTPQSVFFGSDTVYELDTKSFEVLEFLDNTDDAIYYVQIINESHGSYPVAILDVTETHGPGRKEAEYLICFQDIGIFVDSEGRRSRAGDVLWSQVPVAFEYRHPFLYIIHFASVEVQKLDSKSYTKVCESPGKGKGKIESRILMPDVRFLPVKSRQSPNLAGLGANGVVIALHEAQKVKVMEFSAL